MKRLTTLLVVCLAWALLPQTSLAQDDEQSPPTVMISVAQCDRTMIDDLIDRDRERTLPIAQELVDEGMIWSYGVLTHWWGDEWNWVNVMLAADEAAVISANTELGRRYGELYPDDNMSIEVCPRHRDGFYQGIVTTQGGDEDDEDNGDGNAIGVSYYECDFARIGDIVEEEREDLAVYQGVVDDGHLRFRASAVHTWADEWNVLVFASADDIPALLAGLQEAGSRFDDIDPDGSSVLNEACTAHKDNIYAQVYWTTDPTMD